MGRFSKISIAMLLLFPMATNTFIYEVFVLKRRNPSTGRYHYFIGLSDYHDKSNKANRAQVRDLIGMLQNCSTAKTKIGTEDINSKADMGKAIFGRFTVRSKGGVLGGLSKKCRELGFAIDNFEYRFCRVATLGPVLNNLGADMKKFPSVSQTRIQSLITEIDSELNKISSYRDGKELSYFYNHCISQVRGQMKSLRMYDFPHKTVADYLSIVTNKSNRLSHLKKMLTFDSVVLDLKMLHSIVNSRDHVNFLAIAGGSHIGRVSQFLLALGYEEVRAKKTPFVRDYNVRRCLGANIIDGRYCSKPLPIDIRSIKNFL